MQFFFIVAAFIVFSVLSAKVKAVKEAEKAARAAAQKPAQPQTSAARTTAVRPPVPAAQTQRPGQAGAQRPDAAELSREAKELVRQAREFASAVTGRQAEPKPVPAARPTAAKTAARPERRPLVQDDDCGGGSIHDGYHEGVSADPFGEHMPRAAVAGNLGKKLGEEDDRLLREKYAAQNARRALARISKLPPITQGIVYSEILGKPKSEIA